MKPYTIYLASKPISDHETFAEALVEYSKHVGKVGLNMRNDRADIGLSGWTQDEQELLNMVYGYVNVKRRVAAVVAELRERSKESECSDDACEQGIWAAFGDAADLIEAQFGATP